MPDGAELYLDGIQILDKYEKAESGQEEDGTEVVKNVNQAELDRIRLERARALDEERYKDE